MSMRNKVTTLAVAVLLSTAFATTTHAEWQPGDKITICHAAGQAGTTKFVTLTIDYHAVFGPAGHFYENGTPRAGHEDDYFGTCLTDEEEPEVCVDFIEAPPGENCNAPETTVPETTEPPVAEPPVVTPPVEVGPPPTPPVDCSTGVINELGGCEPVGDGTDPTEPFTPYWEQPGPTQSLPSTGSENWMLALVGLAMIGAGIYLVRTSKRS